MAKSKFRHSSGIIISVISVLFFLFAILFILPGCDSSSGNSDGSGSSTTTDFPLAGMASDIDLTAGVTRSFKIRYDLVGLGAYTDLKIDLLKSLANTTVTFPPAAGLAPVADFGENQVRVVAMVGSAVEYDTVCETGYSYGPFYISANESQQPTSVDPPTVTASPATLSHVNAGSFSACVQIYSPVSATVSVDDLAIGTEPCELDAADIAGTWSGTYSCMNSGTGDCSDDIDQPITLYITQDGHSAEYTDGEAEYEGIICGNVFRFNGAGPGYTESGTFTLNADGSGTKTSDWVSDFGECSGGCVDSLQRVSE